MRKGTVLEVLLILAAVGASRTDPLRKETPETSSQFPSEHLSHQVKRGIAGRVIDSNAQPVANADVFVELDVVGSARVLSTTSDKEGRFRIDVSQSGIYTVYASKEKDGYPLTLSGFHQEHPIPIPRITVGDSPSTEDVVVQLGQRAAVLQGVIRDEVTRRSVGIATITLRRVDDPSVLYRVGADSKGQSGIFRLLVPALPFTMEVSSDGYEDWAYGSDRQRTETLKLEPGSRKLDILLKRKKT